MALTSSSISRWIPPHLVDRLTQQQDRYRRSGQWQERLVDLFVRAVASQPEQSWVFYDGMERTAYTLRELATRANGFARELGSRGFGPGDVVVLRVGNRPEAVVGFWGCVLAGVAVAPVSTRDGLPALAAMMADLDARAAVIEVGSRRESAADVEDFVREVGLQVAWMAGPTMSRLPRLNDLGTAATPPGLTAPSPAVAVLSHTSGSSSTPKAACYGDQQLAFESRQLRDVITHRGPLLVASPVGHITGILNLLTMTLLRDDAVVGMARWDPEHAVAIAQAERCSELRGTTLYLQQMADLDSSVGGLAVGMVGGGPVAPRLVEDLDDRGVRLVRAYGSTEHPTVTSSRDTDPLHVRANTDGAPMDGVELRLVDALGRDDDTRGEIQSRGPDAMIGYLRPELDAEVWTPDGWVRSGDIGVRSSEGYITVTDRVKDVIIRAGENISAKEVEDVLHRWDAALEVVVIGVPDSRYGERARAYIIPVDEDVQPTLEGMAAFLAAASVEKYKWPEEVRVVAEMPRTPSGKVRKETLRAQARNGD